LDSSGRERKSWLRPILTIKIIDFGVNKCFFMGKVYIRCFFLLNLLKMINLNLENIFIWG
jgi:hypothetical protein